MELTEMQKSRIEHGVGFVYETNGKEYYIEKVIGTYGAPDYRYPGAVNAWDAEGNQINPKNKPYEYIFECKAALDEISLLNN